MAGVISLGLAIVTLLVGQPSVLLHEGWCYGRTDVLDATRRPVIPNTLTRYVGRFPS